MKLLSKNLYGFLSLVILSVLLGGCNRLPENIVSAAEMAPSKLQRLKEKIDSESTHFKNIKSHHEWALIAPYSKKEQWGSFLTVANESFNKAKKIHESKISPILERNDVDELSALNTALTNFSAAVNFSEINASKIKKRITFLITTRDRAPEIYRNAREEFSGVIKYEKSLLSLSKKAINTYPNKKSDINAKLLVLENISRVGKASMLLVQSEYEKINSGGINYALYGDEANSITNTLNNTSAYHKKISDKLGELYRSYTKILDDQKVNYFVEVSRASWCERDYCGNGRTKHYSRVLVDENVFNYLENLNIEKIATFSRSWGRMKFRTNIPSEYWNALKINYRGDIGSSDDYGEFWVNKMYSKTYHKYIEITDNVKTATEWELVPEDSFWKNYDNLGMALLTKPYGYYEEDALKDAQPAGAAMIAKPKLVNGVATGSNNYGEWRQRNGNSFWHYYGMYSMFNALTGRNRYSYNDWNHYNSRSRGSAYYGRGNKYGTYGTGTYNNPRYKNSDFARRNPAAVKAAKSSKSNRSTRSSSSIRGAGNTSRSRGPAGGGK